jgi:hypothetical protein
MSNLDSNLLHSITISKLVASKRSTTVRVEVIFGVPGKNCDGVGICKIIPLEPVRVHWKCPSARAWLNSTNGTLSLVFDRSMLSVDICEKFFDDEIFQVEEAYTVPQTLLPLLNMEFFTVQPGHYPVQVSEQYFTICF